MISSRQNAKLKDIRRLRRCKGDRALLDGPILVGEALAAGVELEPALATPEFLESEAGRELCDRLPVPPVPIEAGLLATVADTETPQGIVAVAHLPRPGIEACPVEPGVYLYLDRLQDPGNLGAVARVAEATGAVALVTSPACVHPNHPRALRGSAGSLLRLPCHPDVEAAALAEHLTPAGAVWWGLDAHSGAELWQLDAPETVVLVVGSEAHGLSLPARRLCRTGVVIPMESPVESLNAATAAAVVLFELRRRRRSSRTG